MGVQALGEDMGFFRGADMEAAVKQVERGDSAEVGLHVFENPAVAVEADTHPDLLIPLLFAIKERNAGKLSSHAWFFESLCESIQPEVVVVRVGGGLTLVRHSTIIAPCTQMIDAGTQPKADALARFWEAFEENPHLGGCCGELKVFQPRCTQVVNSAQQFEYKMSHIMDKAMESVMGYVSVLPGAFSAYKFEAIQGQPLEKYFYGERNDVTSPFLSNMCANRWQDMLWRGVVPELTRVVGRRYLAEDRILGFEVLVRPTCCNNYGAILLTLRV